MKPEMIRAEVKFTTRSSLSIPGRELQELTAHQPGLGLIAAMFWRGDELHDGRWLIVDARALSASGSRARSFGKADLIRKANGQPSLGWLRDRIEPLWPRLLAGFLQDALGGHETLARALSAAFKDERMENTLPSYRVLAVEHRANIRTVLEKHSETGTGRLFQDFFAFLLGLAGYRSVTVNPVGVPDVIVSDPDDERGIAVGPISRSDIERLRSLCLQLEETRLAELLGSHLARTFRVEDIA
jgi:hypothetical protein